MKLPAFKLKRGGLKHQYLIATRLPVYLSLWSLIILFSVENIQHNSPLAHIIITYGSAAWVFEKVLGLFVEVSIKPQKPINTIQEFLDMLKEKKSEGEYLTTEELKKVLQENKK